MSYDYSAMVALSDPTRRAVFELVAARPRSVADLTRALPVSQPAVSQHLKVLRDAELVQVDRIGTRSIYRLDRKGLERLRTWLDGMWDVALASFAREIESFEEEVK
ncbi:ArsR/SmtB family transcription factor [Devosia albogilva]|uniref:ArsR/SmtB family transcription factor n=1 Tax=Devosia albogilva TaxID=429726 RepID=A0ABW5QEX1_9HYPH